MHHLFGKIQSRRSELESLLTPFEQCPELPLYSSVDLRDAGYKCAVVDTNLFPAGFNNLCGVSMPSAAQILRDAVFHRVLKCRHIVILCEEHTRNVWYLENVRILKTLVERAGFSAEVATFFETAELQRVAGDYLELETASKNMLKIFRLSTLLSDHHSGKKTIDLIILNSDLINGIPENLKNLSVPVYPSMSAGWHSRSKRMHFAKTNGLVDQVSNILEIDPWVLSCYFDSADNVDIHQDEDRIKLADLTSILLKKIKEKYKEHKIFDRPFVFLKSDYGTYGMGVMAIEDPQDIIEMNRKGRNKLFKGKGSKIINRFILQEGVPTICEFKNRPCEVCIYQIANRFVGSFLRYNLEKNTRDNLNSTGMKFTRICLTEEDFACEFMHPEDEPVPQSLESCGIIIDRTAFELYRLLARISGIAAYQEIVQLHNDISVR